MGGLPSPRRQEELGSSSSNSLARVVQPKICHTARSGSKRGISPTWTIASFPGGILNGAETMKLNSLGYKFERATLTPLALDSPFAPLLSSGSVLQASKEGWQIYAFSPLKFRRKASAASTRGSGLQLKKCGSWKVRQDAKRLILRSGKCPHIFQKIKGFRLQSEWSLISQDSASALTFFSPEEYCAESGIPLSRHHIQRPLTSTVT